MVHTLTFYYNSKHVNMHFYVPVFHRVKNFSLRGVHRMDFCAKHIVVYYLELPSILPSILPRRSGFDALKLN